MNKQAACDIRFPRHLFRSIVYECLSQPLKLRYSSYDVTHHASSGFLAQLLQQRKVVDLVLFLGTYW